ncbi:Rhs-family protein [Minicystis rosea]|nr:Rhs-family protein [Minicystis rosea]
MGTTSGGKKVATKKTKHKAVAAPQTSLYPPTPPGAPVPTPVVTTADTSKASGTESATTIAGAEVVVKGSYMATDSPGNAPSQVLGGDIVSHGIAGVAGNVEVTSGSSRTLVDGKGVATTGDTVAMNKPSPKGGVAQQTGALVEGGGAGSSGASTADGGGDDERKPIALLPQNASKTPTAGEPVTVATGFVVDDTTELTLPGMILVEWQRFYSSARSNERGGPFGKGGWTHCFAQWIEPGDDVWRLRIEEGRAVHFKKIAPGETTFHRRDQLTLRVTSAGAFEVESAESRLVRVFAPLDAGGRAVLRLVRDAWGNRVELHYEAGKLARVVDTAGRELRVLSDDKGRIRRVEVWSAGERSELCQWVDYTYHPEGELATATDALGGVLRYEYDGWHRLTKRTTQVGVSFRYTYDDATGRCVRTIGDRGIYEADLHFDLEKRVTFTSGNQEPLKFTWTEDGLVVREETLDGQWARVREYDEDHHLLSEANAAGEKIKLRYDARANLVERIDQAGNTTTFEYDDDRLVAHVDPRGHATTYAYDGRGALEEVTHPTGERFTLTYDGRGRVTAMHGNAGLVASFTYDEQHNLVQETDGRGAVTRCTYDVLGRPLTRTDALGRVTRVEYDRLGRRIALHRPDRTTARCEYDAIGRAVAVTDEEGHTTRMEYAGQHALVKLIDPTEQEWHFKYDELERLRSITDPRAEEYRLHYDDAGRVIEETSFHGRTLRYTYSLAENLSRIDYPDRTFRNLAYDPLGNVIADLSPHGTIKVERDRLGLVKKAVLTEYNGKVVTSFERDTFGRVIKETQDERTITFAYDEQGRRTARTLPNGATTHYHYDAQGDIVGVEHDGHRVAIQRDVLGRDVRRHVYAGGVDILRAYDAMDRLVDQQVTAPAPTGVGAATLLSRRQLQYDNASRVRTVADARHGTTTYQHDPLGQLIEAALGRHREVFDYDGTGGLFNMLRDLADVDRIHPFHTREGDLLTETPSARYENDGQGRRTKHTKKRTGVSTEYLWDCRDRLRETRLSDGRRVLYTYDAFGRRVRKQIVPAERRDIKKMVVLAYEKGPEALPPIGVVEYLWDGNVLAGELDPEKGARFFVHEPGTFEPMLHQEQGEVFTYINDHLGIPKELVDQDGRVAWAAMHSAWGQVIETWRDPQAKRAVSTPFRLMGQFLDEETGLCYTRFRYFDPEVGRWISPDPLGVRGGRNLFAFDGSPAADVDPWGLLRNSPGKAYMGENHPDPENWMKGTERNAGRIPKSVAEALKGRWFRTFDDFREAFWRAVAADPKASARFDEGQVKTMRRGESPFTTWEQQYKGQKRYVIHHLTPIQHGGGVYDMGNLAVVTPRFHQSILDRGYHF